MTSSLPDWLVERAALDEVPAASRERIDRADPRELADRIAAVREATAHELASHPAAPAIAQIERRVAAETKRLAADTRRRRGWLAIAGAAVVAVAIVLVTKHPTETATAPVPGEVTRVKGVPHLMAFRQVGDKVERLDEDAVVRAGDVLQLRYDPGGRAYGVIASIDGAGVVTLHFPLGEDAPPQATAVATKTTTLPHAYALDDAPRFERFFFITANEPIDVQHSLAALRTLARRPDSAAAQLELPAGLRQWSLRLRKPNYEMP